MCWDQDMQAQSTACNQVLKTSYCWCKDCHRHLKMVFGLPAVTTMSITCPVAIRSAFRLRLLEVPDTQARYCLRALHLLSVHLDPASETRICRSAVAGARR